MGRVSRTAIKIYGLGSFMPKTSHACSNSLTGVIQGPPSCTTHLDYSECKKTGKKINIKSHSNLSQHPICQCIHSLMIHGHQLLQKVQSNHKNHSTFRAVSVPFNELWSYF